MRKKPEKTFDEAEYYEGDRSELGGEDRDVKESKNSSTKNSAKARFQKLEKALKKFRLKH